MAAPVIRNCVKCGCVFATWAWCRNNIFCSDDCNFLHYVTPTDPDLCWEWQGLKDAKGYGGFGAKQRAHRYSYRYYKGTLTKGKVIRHLCNNPGCVNPSHLEEGTYQENSDDRKAVGPIIGLRGEANKFVKLTDDQVREIYSSKEDYKVLAEKFNISKARVRDILHGRGWNHITGAPKFTPQRIYKKRVK